MDFSLTPEQQQIGETARRFGVEKLAPGYAAREQGRHIAPSLFDAIVGHYRAIGDRKSVV